MGLAGNEHFQRILILELVLAIETEDDRETIQIGESAGDFSGHEKSVDEKRVAQFLRGHADNVLGTRHPADWIIKHGAKLETHAAAVNAKFSFQGRIQAQ